jgi:hypothetical protein
MWLEVYILTTDLDAGVPVIWNMGAIAASDSPDALMLFRQVMLASASIPVAVAPVLISVTAHHQFATGFEPINDPAPHTLNRRTLDPDTDSGRSIQRCGQHLYDAAAARHQLQFGLYRLGLPSPTSS